MLDPFLEFGFLRRALVGCLALAVAAPPLGVFLTLRRLSLTAEVLGHAILPGIAAGYWVAGLSAAAMWGGGLVAGLAVALGAGALARATRTREDSTLTALYLLALAAGVGMVSVSGGAGDLSTLLFGSVLGVDDAALMLMAGAATVTLAGLAFAWRPLALEGFDPGFAEGEGVRGGAWHLFFLALVVLNVLAAFQAMGTLMAVGLMMLPAIAARHWSRRLGGMVYASVGIAALASFLGLLLSYHIDLPSGPAIVLTAGALWATSVLAGPVEGLLWRWLKPRHLDG